jgi:uncharacterized protein YndB with AHSA1/START domain
MDFETRMDITADRATAWQALMAVDEWPRWTASMTSVERLDEGPLRLGSRARIKQPAMPALVWQVTELVEREVFTWEARSPGAVTSARHTLEERPDGISLALTIQQRGFLADVVGRLYAGRTRRYLDLEINGLKAFIEQPQTSKP